MGLQSSVSQTFCLHLEGRCNEWQCKDVRKAWDSFFYLALYIVNDDYNGFL